MFSSFIIATFIITTFKQSNYNNSYFIEGMRISHYVYEDVLSIKNGERIIYEGKSTIGEPRPPRDLAIKKYLKEEKSEDWLKDCEKWWTDCNPISQEKLDRIKTEVKTLRRLQQEETIHPNIIKFHDFFDREETFYYLVMEKMADENLFDKIAKKDSYNEKEVRDHCEVILKALNFMHERGIVHRNLKPENLLLVAPPRQRLLEPLRYVIKITDFELAECSDDSQNGGLGSIISRCDTERQYMSPEICSNNPYGTKTDMWSFGTILFALLSGSLPFTADNYHALFHRINEGTFEYPPGLEDLLSENVKTLIRSLFTVDPTSRWSAQQALESAWFRTTMDGSLNNIDLTGNLKILIRFNAKRRLRAAVLSLIATEKLRRYPANGRLRAAVLTVIATRRFQERYPVGGNGI